MSIAMLLQARASEYCNRLFLFLFLVYYSSSPYKQTPSLLDFNVLVDITTYIQMDTKTNHFTLLAYHAGKIFCCVMLILNIVQI